MKIADIWWNRDIQTKINEDMKMTWDDPEPRPGQAAFSSHVSQNAQMMLQMMLQYVAVASTVQNWGRQLRSNMKNMQPASKLSYFAAQN